MNPEAARWERVKAVFQEALELPAPARTDLLAAQTPEVAAEVASLLAHSESSAGFLEAPLLRLPAEAVGRRIGPYRVLGVLGQGGMGTVYLAERADDAFQKQVAIKCVRPGSAPEFTQERFLQERRILAGLEHPNIARLLDGGTTGEGLVYFVMERIEGIPITEHCRAKALGLRERLELFRTVCAAVHHAHQNLVVHRDLKSANILVTADGSPKLLDFGIAKLLGPGAPDATLTLLPWLTLACASPEQVRGEPVTTASDIYSLGVLLYELSAGVPPYQVSATRPEEILAVVCEREPPRPSTAAVGDPAARAWRRSLRGDLDNIVMMALRKEPLRRYGSAQQLGEDLRRHLEGLPVSAREETLGYRTGKFIRRHAVWTAAGALAGLSLLAGTAISWRQARVARAERAKAERSFQEVRAVANALLFEFNDAIRDVPGTLRARQLLVNRAVSYLDGLAREAGEDPKLRGELAESYTRLAQVAMDAGTALANHRKALALREALAAPSAGDPEARRTLAACLAEVANCLRMTGDTAGAGAASSRALALLDGEDPATKPERHRGTLLEVLWEHARVLGELGQHAQAQQALARAARLAEAERRAAPDNPARRHGVIVCALFLGDSLLETGRPAEALHSFRAALEEAEAGRREAPGSALMVRDAIITLRRVSAALTAAGEPRRALEPLGRARTGILRLMQADPMDIGHRRVLTFAHLDLGDALSALGDSRAARASYREALRVSLAVAAEDPSRVESRVDAARALASLGLLEAKAGRPREARARLEEARRAYADLSQANPAHAALRREMARVLQASAKLAPQRPG